MNSITFTLEDELLSKFKTKDNQLGLGKIIYDEKANESLISNGKSLITYRNTKLVESVNVSIGERTRMVNLTNTLIHNNYGDMIACELYFSKEDIYDLLGYMERYSSKSIKLEFNSKLKVVLVSTTDNPALVKILQPQQINICKNCDMSSKVEIEQLYNLFVLLSNQMTNESVLGIALQYKDRPLLMATENVSGCISCIKD